MLHRLFFFAILAALAGLALWDIARRNPGLFPTVRRPRPRRRPRLVPPRSAARKPPPPGGQVLAFARPPHEVLGLEKHADLDTVEAAYRRLRAEYAPERLADMSEELRGLAEQRTQELDRAVQALRRRLQ